MTLTRARVFKQRLPPYENIVSGVESGARSKGRESSEQNSVENMTFRHSLRLFYCYCMLINNLEFQIYWQLYSVHDYKWSHVFSNSKIEVALSSCFGKNYFFYFSCTWNSGEVKPDLAADQFKETNKAGDTSRLACDKNPIFFSYWNPFSLGEWPNCVQMSYPAGTRFDCHKHWIFYLARSFGGLIKLNCNVPM